MLVGGATSPAEVRRGQIGTWLPRAVGVVVWLVVISMFAGVVAMSVVNAAGAGGHVAAGGGVAWA